MLGLINFTHTDPLYEAFEDRSKVLRETPKKILESLLSGSLKCGMISLFEYYDHMDVLELVESATIHSTGGTMSTLLVSNRNVLEEPLKIAVTEHTRTTAVYLELVLRKMGLKYSLTWSSKREAHDLLKEGDYALVIGDEALRVYGTSLRIIWDIGFQFRQLFSRMPVFSVTVKRKGTDCDSEIESLNRAVKESWKFVDGCISKDSRRLSIPTAILERYFGTIRYEFSSGVRDTVSFLEKYSRSQDS